jgi:hypothetical protein
MLCFSIGLMMVGTLWTRTRFFTLRLSTKVGQCFAPKYQFFTPSRLNLGDSEALTVESITNSHVRRESVACWI